MHPLVKYTPAAVALTVTLEIFSAITYFLGAFQNNYHDAKTFSEGADEVLIIGCQLLQTLDEIDLQSFRPFHWLHIDH